MKKEIFFKGVSTALVTPFYRGKIDFKSLRNLIKHQIDAGIQGLVVSGSTGEAATLTVKEKSKLLNFVLSEVSGEVPVIMGSGTNNTLESVALTKLFSKTKVSGFLIVTPYYNKPPQRGLIEHFKIIAQSTKKPVIVYNVPSRTVTPLKVSTVLQLSKIKNIVGIKEATGDLSIIKDLVKVLPKSFSILSGDDETFVSAMNAGAHGVISVISHVVPRLCLYATDKDIEKIKLISHALFSESNPIPVKWALKEMGIIKSDELRLPLVPFDENLKKKTKQVLKQTGVL